AGGAYVPLDASYPRERLAYMVQDAAVAVIVTQEQMAAEFSELGVRLVRLDSDWEEISRYSETNLVSEVNGANLAYVTYTSGSTGQPKGVCITQQAVTRLVRNVSYVELSSAERVLQASPLAFDASTFELWSALLLGGCCVLYAERVPTAAGL